MKRISLIFIAFVMTIGGAHSALAQSNNDKIIAEIVKLEAEHIEASKKFAREVFDRIQTADFMVTARIPARIQTREQVATLLKDPNFKRGTIESLENDDVKVRVYNDNTAIATGHWKRVSRDGDGKDTSMSGRFTRVWIKQNGRWLLAAAHYSPDIDPEKLMSGQTENRKN